MMLKLTWVACQMAQTWWLKKFVDLDRDGILHPIHYHSAIRNTTHPCSVALNARTLILSLLMAINCQIVINENVPFLPFFIMPHNKD